MSSNKTVHNQLAKIYGDKCMFLAIHKDDADFKRFVQSKRYSSKELNRLIKNITVHHLKHRSEGGKTDVKNCSLINELAHRYLHSLPRQDEEVINNSIREYKDNARECKIELVDTLDIGIEVKCAEISFSDEIKPPKEKFDRAKVKQETRNKIREWEDER